MRKPTQCRTFVGCDPGEPALTKWLVIAGAVRAPSSRTVSLRPRGRTLWQSVQEVGTARHGRPEHQVVAQHSTVDDATTVGLGQLAERGQVGH